MRFICIVTLLLTNGQYYEGFPIRLWPTNSEGTEGFVEAFYNGSWGFVGNPVLQFTDATATFLCKTMGLSQFGYGSGWTSIENYTGHSWLFGLECHGSETYVEQCMRQYSFEFNNYTSQSNWNYRYGSRLYCVDSKLVEGETENIGVVHSAFSGKIYTICYDGFDMNAANVVCNHLRYNGSVKFTKGDPGSIPVYNKQLICDGREHSLTNCNKSIDIIENCSDVVYITCRAVRWTHWNEYNDEGAVEIYHNGSWGFIGTPGFSFDEVTAKYLCEMFGFEDGFSTTAHPLDTYYRKAWLSSLACTGQETHIMQCQHSGFRFTPSLMNTYRRGTWLYCFDFNISSVRLVNGSTSYEGIVELEVGGRWGSICTYAMSYLMKELSGDVVCKSLGYRGINKLLEDEIEFDYKLFWMSYISCEGTESSLMDCNYTKGPIDPCYYSHVALAVQCIFDFPIRLWPTNLQGTEGFVEVFFNGSWGFVGNPALQFTDATATFLCKTFGLSQFGYGSGWTSMENYTGHSWINGLECYGNETSVQQCMGQYILEFNNYTSRSDSVYRYGSRLYCVDSKLVEGETENTGVVHSAFSGKIYTICYDGFDINAANVVCNHLRYNGSVKFTKRDPGSIPIYKKQLICDGGEHSLEDCSRSTDIIENCSDVVYITCRAVRLTRWNEYNNEGAVEIYHKGSWGFVGISGYNFDDVTAKYLCETFGFESDGFSTRSHSLEKYHRHAWLSYLTCTGQESHIMQCEHGNGFTRSRNAYKVGTWLYCFDFNISSIRLVNGSTSYEGKVEVKVGGRWGSICTFLIHSITKDILGDVVCKSLGYAGKDKLLDDKMGIVGDLIWMSSVSCSGTASSLMDCVYIKGPLSPCNHYPVNLAVRCIDIDECLSSPCLNGGSCINGDQSYVCQCSNTTKWGGTNCEIDLEPDSCAENPCLNAGSCENLTPEGFKCFCAAGFDGDICQINIDECTSLPCGNGGCCLDLVGEYECSCLLGYTGNNCQTNIDECSSSPCANDGICEDLIDEFKCHCTNSFEGNFCEKEIESHTTLIAVLVSALCSLVLGIALTGCLCLIYRRKQTKLKSRGKPKPNKGDDVCQTPTAIEQERAIHIAHYVKENDALETDQHEVYAEIKDGETDDYLTPASTVGPAKGDDGYLTFVNDEHSTVRYYNLKATKHDDYSKLSRPAIKEAE